MRLARFYVCFRGLMRVGGGLFGSRMGRGMGRWEVGASKRLD